MDSMLIVRPAIEIHSDEHNGGFTDSSKMELEAIKRTVLMIDITHPRRQ